MTRGLGLLALMMLTALPNDAREPHPAPTPEEEAQRLARIASAAARRERRAAKRRNGRKP